MLASSVTPKPNIISASGMKAMAGIGRSASMVGPVMRSAIGNSPSTVPQRMPMTAAKASPNSAASKVW